MFLSRFARGVPVQKYQFLARRCDHELGSDAAVVTFKRAGVAPKRELKVRRWLNRNQVCYFRAAADPMITHATRQKRAE